MDKAERERLVADAILLERAASVLDRRKPDIRTSTLGERQHHDLTTWLLRDQADELRQEAESDVPAR